MIKNYAGGTIINYGPTLPQATETFDGTLFFKTEGADRGLHVFSFLQDTSVAIGDQVGQGWSPLATADMFVKRSGDVMTGSLGVKDLLRITTTEKRAQSIILGSQSYDGEAAVFESDNKVLKIGLGNVFGSGVTASNYPALHLSPAIQDSVREGLRWGGNKVWHAGNHGANSGLDADLLDGRQGSEYLDKATFVIDPLSSTQKLKESVLPFQPVEQAGSTKIKVGMTGSRLMLTTGAGAATNTWPINVAGRADIASQADSATTAVTAGSATTASFVRSSGSVSTSLSFNADTQVGTPAFIWASQDRTSSGMFKAEDVTVGRATTAGTADNALTANNAQNAVQAEVATNVDWTGIRDLGSGAIAAFPQVSGVSLTARPQYFQRYTVDVPAPSQVFGSTLSTLETVAPSNLGNSIGFTIKGSGESAVQVIFDGSKFQYRSNAANDTWGPFKTIWDSANMSQQFVFTHGTVWQGGRVWPPTGFAITDLVAFIPSINSISFAGDVDKNDTLRCYWFIADGNSVQVDVYNSEQRSAGLANFLAVWRKA